MSLRFISSISGYRLVVIHQQIELLASGLPRVLSPGFTAEFKHGDTTDHEREVGLRELTFRGQTLEMDGTPTDMRNRISSFDTATIPADAVYFDPQTKTTRNLREAVEEGMLANPDCGKQDGYILVEKPALLAPWASYDELVAQGRRTPDLVASKNIETAEATGVSLEHLIAYERENRNDGKIIAAYEQALAAAPVPVEAEPLVPA